MRNFQLHAQYNSITRRTSNFICECISIPMYLKSSVIFSVIIVLNTFNAQAYNIKLKNELLQELLQNFDFEDKVKYNLNENRHKQGRNVVSNLVTGKFNLIDKFPNKMLVKRLLPHGYESSGIEYDKKYNSYYLPLVRIHGVKPRLVFKNVENRNRGRGNNLRIVKSLLGFKDNKYGNRQTKEKRTETFEIVDRRPVFGKRYKLDDELLSPLKLQPRKVTFQTILSDIKAYIKKLRTKSEMRRLKYAVLSVLENYSPDLELRTKVPANNELEKMYEEMAQFDEHLKKKPKLYPPPTSFWSYWTVSQSSSE